MAKQRCIYNFDKDLRCAADSSCEEGYNSNITMEELCIAIGSAKNNSSGLDEVTAMLLRSLPDNMIVELLYIINEL